MVANAKIYSKNKTSIYKIVEKEKKKQQNLCLFCCPIETAKFIATVLDEG